MSLIKILNKLGLSTSPCRTLTFDTKCTFFKFSLDKQYASFSSALDVISSLCRYLTKESIIRKIHRKSTCF